jgi:transcriptional regulator with XRE-family HTH domain
VATQGEKLRKFRRGRTLTQRQLAERAGVAERTVVLLESDKSEARPATLRKLADALEVDPMELIGE